VNSYTTSSQYLPSVASGAGGNFVVVWQSHGQDGESGGIFGQRYDSGGVAQGDEFRVNSYTLSSQRLPSVASDASGNFVVVWQLSGLYGAEGIFGQRYDSAGVPQGEEFQVNSGTAYPGLPSVASDTIGNFVVVWDDPDVDSTGVFGQRYDSAGVAQGDEFQVNTFTTDRQAHASVGATGTNAFVVAWESEGQDGSEYGGSSGRTTSARTRRSESSSIATTTAATKSGSPPKQRSKAPRKAASPGPSPGPPRARRACASRGPTIRPSPTSAT
jgi:hypothetical protein